MKKIGIITFHASHNCGSILQAYALQKVILDRYNQESEIIDFSNEKQRELYSIFCKNDSVKKIIKNLIAVFHYKLLKQHFIDYQKFINNKLVLSKNKYKNTNELFGIENNYSLLISGGDQIWNIKCYDADDSYFLNFAANIKKVAYSPSLGAIDIVKYTDNPEKYRKFLADYKFLSVREYNGKKWLEELTGRNVPIIADPTLLLNKEDWEQEALEEPLIKGEYILYYSFHYPGDVNKVVKAISKKTGLPVIVIDAKSWGIRALKLYGFSIYKNGGPQTFLNLVKYAKLVFTMSLHGTIFSAVLEKKFWYLDSSLHNDDDDRASFLLEQLSLTHRKVHVDKILETNLFEEINYKKTKDNIAKMQKDSFDYLKQSLEN